MKRTAAKPVLDGSKLKWTLEQSQVEDSGRVRLDWLRFTLPLGAVVKRDASLPQDLDAVALLDRRGRDVVREANAVEDEYTAGPAVAKSAALALLEALPKAAGFALGEVEARGKDYYTAHASILCNGREVGQVLAGGKQITQSATVHVNLYGAACLHLTREDYIPLHNLISQAKGWITRVDLALDFFHGHDITATQAAYLSGEFDVRGKRPSQREIGSWTNGHSRTFEVGNRETGKLFRGYEKGDEQLGHEANDPWVRYEVEIRNNNRIIDLAVLRNPADYFAGAYPYCENVLVQARAEFAAKGIKTKQVLLDKTAQARVTKTIQWIRRTAAPSVAAALVMGGDWVFNAILDEAYRLPGKLVGFSVAELTAAFAKIAPAAPPRASLLSGA